MEGTEKRKHGRTKRTLPTLRLSFEQGEGHPRLEVMGQVLEASEQGCRLRLANPFPVGSAVRLDRSALNATVSGAVKQDMWAARVIWCGVENAGRYTAGLCFVEPYKGKPEPDAGTNSSADGPVKDIEDWYEVLQINVKAEPETIHRVYRLLAQRLHPDNPDTGNETLFRQLVDAYRVLSDPAQRAAYDVKLGIQNRHRWRIFDQSNSATGPAAEKAKRAAILQVLYTRRRNEPAQPAVTVNEMEDLLGCPKEHLEFGLWYLKEKGYVVRSDNGRFVITANGVEAAEISDRPLEPDRNRLPWSTSGAA